MLFHLAHPFLAGQKRIQVETALERLNRHGRGNYNDYTLELTFPPNPDGLYLLTKGGGRDVWDAFGVRKKWRKGQGLIAGSALARQKILALLLDNDGASRRRCRLCLEHGCERCPFVYRCLTCR
jgi:hypothetical protein